MRHERLVDLSMAVEEREGEVVFLKRVVPGPAAGSYGIHVAGLAGIPRSVVERAEEIRESLAATERSRSPAAGHDGLPPEGPVAPPKGRRQPDAGSLFSAEELVLDELAALELDRLSPLDALNRLAGLQKRLGPRRR